MNIWIETFGREYWVIVNGVVYDKMYLQRGKKLRRDDLKDIADGYREALEDYGRYNSNSEGAAGWPYVQDEPRWKK